MSTSAGVRERPLALAGSGLVVMRSVVDVGSRLLKADRGLDSAVGLGVDEHAWQRTRPRAGTPSSATGVVWFRLDGPVQLREITPRRSGKAYARLSARQAAWRD